MKRLPSPPDSEVLRQFKRLRVVCPPVKRTRKRTMRDEPGGVAHPAHRTASRASQRAAGIALHAAQASRCAVNRADQAVLSACHVLARAHGRLQLHVRNLEAHHLELSERHLRTLRELHDLRRTLAAQRRALHGSGSGELPAVLDDAVPHVVAH